LGWVERAARCLRRGRPSVIPVFRNALAAFSLRRMMAALAHRAMA